MGFCGNVGIACVIAYLNTHVIAYLITYVIAYPYAWTVNLEICLEAQLRTYQPPIPNSSQASAWCYRYIGCWMGKPEGSPTGLGKNFGRLNS